MAVTTTLRHLLKDGKTIIAPGVFDGLSARLAEQAGFPVIYASGGAIARSTGFPDIGLLSLHEVLTRLRNIVEVTTCPVIADADTGFGNVNNVKRTVREFEQVGVAGLHLEDQVSPKRCGHLNGKALIDTTEMVDKIKVARDTLQDDDFLIIARTDAIAVEGFEQALNRAEAYLAAGADMIFVEAPTTLEQIEAIAKHLPQPKLINMFCGGKTPMVPIETLQSLGYLIVIIPSDLQRAAIKAMQTTLSVIKQTGDSASIQDQLTTFDEREVIVGTKNYLR